MNYELVKKLKEAGFPYVGVWRKYRDDEGNDGDPDLIWPDPTLSELIEACGEDFGSLNRNFEPDDGLWRAVKKGTVHVGIITEGKTPEIAVANLWLELNKK